MKQIFPFKVVHVKMSFAVKSFGSNSWWTHKSDLVKNWFDHMLIVIIQSGFNFEHATTAWLSWHVQNLDLIG